MKMKTPSNTLIAKWSGMTDGNYHPEVRLGIAKWFDLKPYIDYFREYIQYRDAHEGLEISDEYFDEYCKKTNEMLGLIGKLYGEETQNRVDDCL